ncbi:hypothetical protein BpHYR1_021786 [Brachionus plicatilis]|uniref:Uncharacterized protein n=1 Tax=Brachionus plicatilis TaxID=10195 RepID=A0A3M7P895_BRAPC|nr:hypothetical protein BpHYR1_021786 [Brachionus plicatilis]
MEDMISKQQYSKLILFTKLKNKFSDDFLFCLGLFAKPFYNCFHPNDFRSRGITPIAKLVFESHQILSSSLNLFLQKKYQFKIVLIKIYIKDKIYENLQIALCIKKKEQEPFWSFLNLLENLLNTSMQIMIERQKNIYRET